MLSANVLQLTVITTTLSFNVLPLTLATALLNVNVLLLKVVTATVSAYMLTLTFATVLTVANAKLSVYGVGLPLTVLTTTLSFNVLTRFQRLQMQSIVFTCCH